jgi:hypothetical protein
MSEEKETETTGMDARETKADAKAAKAKAKALRPWFKKKRFIVPIAILLIAGVANVANAGDSTPSGTAESQTSEASTEATTDSPAESESAAAGIGDVVGEGNFSFVVNSVECGIASVGSDPFGEEAQGEFCQIRISVENTGNQAEYFSSSSQLVYDADGREFEADTTAMLYLEDEDAVWIGDDINPGNRIDATLLFDMPSGVVPVTITLIEGYFGAGVDVSLI